MRIRTDNIIHLLDTITTDPIPIITESLYVIHITETKVFLQVAEAPWLRQVELMKDTVKIHLMELRIQIMVEVLLEGQNLLIHRHAIMVEMMPIQERHHQIVLIRQGRRKYNDLFQMTETHVQQPNVVSLTIAVRKIIKEKM
jgi:hypothetical protein